MSSTRSLLVHKGRLLFIILGLAVITFAADWKVTSAGFLFFDDGEHVYANNIVTSDDFSDIQTFWKEPYNGLYIPLTYTVWSIEAKSYKLLTKNTSLSPHIFHITNLIVHILTVLLVFGILIKVSKNHFAAFCGALFFALHPVQVESVAWISELKGVLAGFFSMLSLLLYINHISNQQEDQRYTLKSIWYLGAVLASLLALLSKPSAIVTPLLAGVFSLFIYNRSWKRTARDILPWLMVIIPIMVYTANSQSDLWIDFIPPMFSRLLIAGDAISFYLYKLFVPIPLCIDYGRFPQAVLRSNWIWLTGTIPYAAMLGIFLGGLKYDKIKPVAGSILIFVIALSPVLGIKPFMFQHISTVADRYIYIAMLGPALIVGFILTRYRNTVVRLVSLAVLLVFFLLTSHQITTWKSNETLLTYTKSINPHSMAYYKILTSKAMMEGDLASMRNYCHKMIEINDCASIHNLLGYTFLKQGKMIQAKQEFYKAMRINPNLVNTYEILGGIYTTEGDYRSAERTAYTILKLDKFNAIAYNILGVACQIQNKRREAIEYLLIAKTLDPELMIVYESLGYMYSSLGDHQKAVAIYKEALEHDPSNAQMKKLLADAQVSLRPRPLNR